MNLPTDFQQYIHQRTYAKYLPEKGRRETWEETVARYFDFMQDHLHWHHDYFAPDPLWKELQQAVLNLEIMPSMRVLATAGTALERCNVAGFNCSYLPIDSVRAFDETLYILMCGTGVGFSVERQYISNLPEIPAHFKEVSPIIQVADSKAGWAGALKELVMLLYSGVIPRWDLSRVRPAGARLKTFGGRSSGPGPLEDLFVWTTALFKAAQGRKLTSLECHDLICKIASVVISGGVRRSALISLSNFSDDRMRHAKIGEWYLIDPQRSYANNSSAYTEKPDEGAFMREWNALYASGSGERGIFNREAMQAKAAENGRRDPDRPFGTNPCGEIILRPFQFCNLSEVVFRAGDKPKDILRKARLAAILGTFQSSLTNFKYLRKIWTDNTEEERLLGVSLTGILDCRGFYATPAGKIKDVVIDTNAEFAALLGIPQSVATTCIKPSGTVSKLVNSSSGMHPRPAPYYIQRIRCDKMDPLTTFMKEAGIPCEDCVISPDHTAIFSFPIKSPRAAVVIDNMPAMDQLELWSYLQREWCEHNPSCTIYIQDGEWMKVGAWVYENFDQIGGLSFSPAGGLTHPQLPQEPINASEYKTLLASMPKKIDWASFKEDDDNTTASQELACFGGQCDL